MDVFGYFFNQVTAHKKPKKEFQKLGEWGTLKVWLIIAIAIVMHAMCELIKWQKNPNRKSVFGTHEKANWKW